MILKIFKTKPVKQQVPESKSNNFCFSLQSVNQVHEEIAILYTNES